MSVLFSQLPFITEGKIISDSGQPPVKFLITDSRSTNTSVGSLFFAIKGYTHDGHEYIPELYQKGYRQFVIEDENYVLTLPSDCSVFLAVSTIDALQNLAIFHRNKFTPEVVGITGSNGKTIVKEWLNQLLCSDYTIVKSPKSYNSQIGVPLSVWQMNKDHNLGIFEAGISRPGEMVKLEEIIRPGIGIFTNLGPAHSEGFFSMREKLEEKALLFINCHTVIYRKGEAEPDDYFQRLSANKKIISWSTEKKADYNIKIIQTEGKRLRIKILHQDNQYYFQLPFNDDASFENVIHCIVLLLHFKIDENAVQSRILSLTNVPMRLELKAGRNNSYIIDDTYNNDIEGLRIAIQFMQQQNLKKRKILILSDMLETGMPDSELYKEVGVITHSNHFNLFIGIGTKLKQHANYFPEGSLFYNSSDSFLEHAALVDLSEALVLIKGARIFRFELLVQSLAHKIHRTVLEINLNSLSHNLNVYRSLLKPETKMMVMVKAFAYGSGSHEVAHLLQYNSADYLAVAYTDEGIALRESNVTMPVMVMNPTPEEFDKLVRYKLEPEIYNFRLLNAYISYIDHEELIANNSYVPPIHLAVDTGMHRLGFEEFQLEELCANLNTAKIVIASVFSHLVGADEHQFDEFSHKQIRLFKKIADRIQFFFKYKITRHILNSAGITRFKEHELDMVRLGIGLYGIESEGHSGYQKLQNVSTLKTVVSQIRSVKKGDSIGYSRKGLAERDIRVATVAIGYGDGYSRKFSNGIGKMLVRGKLASVIGNVCMDLCMLDVTGIDVQEGDEVIVFGKDIPVTKLASDTGTIPYEILTGVSERVKRVFYLD